MTRELCDVYVFVKPNEDFAAIHDGKRKLDYAGISTYLLNKGGSYSAHYVANSIALEKYLQSKYARTVVLGLSQGGDAALLNALQTRPTAAVVASGFSVLDEVLSWANSEQIIVPGYYRGFNAKVRDGYRRHLHAFPLHLWPGGEQHVQDRGGGPGYLPCAGVAVQRHLCRPSGTPRIPPRPREAIPQPDGGRSLP